MTPPKTALREGFWELPLEQLTASEWEALCDGCGRCCLIKLADEDTDDVVFTDLCCRYLDTKRCRCQVYSRRHEKEPDCIEVTARIAHSNWLPASCAYRLRAQGRPLPAWHPLLSGDPGSVRAAGISVAGRVTAETWVAEEDWEDHVIHWVEN